MSEVITDEWLMERLEWLIEHEHHLALDGGEAGQEMADTRGEAGQIYKELMRRGYRWSDRENDWIKSA